MGAEVDVTNAVFNVVCNEGEGGVGGDVYAQWVTEPFVCACDCVGVGVDAFDGTAKLCVCVAVSDEEDRPPIADEEEGVVGA